MAPPSSPATVGPSIPTSLPSTEPNDQPRYSRPEDLTSGLIHAVGAALSVVALVILVTAASLHGDVWRVVSFSIYGASLVLLYHSSTFYHVLRTPGLKRVFRIFDHANIFLLIAGTYTPFALVTLRGAWGWTMFGVIWGLAIAGIATMVFAMKHSKLLMVAIYVPMGWVAVIAIKPLVAALPAAGIGWVFIGGGFYTLGTVFYVWRQLPFHHSIWHLFVLGGSVSHFIAILNYVLPMSSGSN